MSLFVVLLVDGSIGVGGGWHEKYFYSFFYILDNDLIIPLTDSRHCVQNLKTISSKEFAVIPIYLSVQGNISKPGKSVVGNISKRATLSV